MIVNGVNHMLELKYKDYMNKVHGGWIGKCIGGAIGAMQENNKSLMEYSIENVFPEAIPPNDDLDLQILWLQEILEKKGSIFTSDDIAEVFAKYNLEIVNEYAVAIKNIELGIMPPMSGLFNNTYFKNSMGCPIRSEIWGFICPGNPEAAVRFAHMDGMIDHDAESINGEKFFATLEANAFFEDDIIKLLKTGLSYIPENTVLACSIDFILEQYRKDIPWKSTREKLIKRFGSVDASYSVVNIGITILALLYGQGDFSSTLMIAVNSGYDTDCTAATAGAILGLIIGADNIPDFWKQKIGLEFIIGTVSIKRYSNMIYDLAKDTCTAGLCLIRDGHTSVNILDVPEDVKLSLPLPVSIPEVEINIEYHGKPTIGYGEKSKVTAILKNNSKFKIAGTVTVEAPEYLTVSIDKMEVEIEPQSEAGILLEFEVKTGTKALPQKNIIKAVFTSENKKITDKVFGLSGASRMKLIGPFFDNYDTKIYKYDPFNGKRQQNSDGTMDLFAMFNGFANIDKAYIDESFVNVEQVDGEYVNFHEDKLEIDEKVSYKGPCCIYLVYDFICPEDMDNSYLHIGNNDSYKIWFNGKKVIEDKRQTMWMPLNSTTLIKINSGINRMIMKVVRSGGSFEFSCIIGNHEHRDRFVVNLSSLIEEASIRLF